VSEIDHTQLIVEIEYNSVVIKYKCAKKTMWVCRVCVGDGSNRLRWW